MVKLLQGYYENTETTLAAIDNDQFFRTGDVGYMNADGILNIVDRKKDIFKYHMHHVSFNFNQINFLIFLIWILIP